MKLVNLFEVARAEKRPENHAETMQKKYEELSKLLTAEYSDALKKFDDGIKISRMSNSTYDWKVLDTPRTRRTSFGNAALRALYDWFALENDLPARMESIFGFTKQNFFADKNNFGDNRYYIFPKNGTKIVCLRKDFNSEDSGSLYSYISDITMFYIEAVKKEVNTDFLNYGNSPSGFMDYIVIPMADYLNANITKTRDISEVIKVLRSTKIGDKNCPTPKDLKNAPLLMQLIKSKNVKHMIDDIESAFENLIDVKTPKTIDSNYQEVFMSGNCILVQSSLMDGYVKYLNGDR